MSWTDERIATLKKMWEGGSTASQIADELGGVSRNAVIGKAHRLGLKSRPSPVKSADKKAAPAKKAAPVKTPAKQAPTKKTAAVKKPTPAPEAAADTLVVKEGEGAWTPAELAEVLTELEEQRTHSLGIVAEQEDEPSGLMRLSGVGAGQDQADLGATTFERDHEMSVLNNEREKLAQIDRALARIEDDWGARVLRGEG